MNVYRDLVAVICDADERGNRLGRKLYTILELEKMGARADFMEEEKGKVRNALKYVERVNPNES